MKSLEQKRDELAALNCLEVAGIIKRIECFTVDKHLGNPQQYEHIKLPNEDYRWGFKEGFDAGSKLAQFEVFDAVLARLKRHREDHGNIATYGYEMADWLESHRSSILGTDEGDEK